jgi:hypothetical protein
MERDPDGDRPVAGALAGRKQSPGATPLLLGELSRCQTRYYT